MTDSRDSDDSAPAPTPALASGAAQDGPIDPRAWEEIRQDVRRVQHWQKTFARAAADGSKSRMRAAQNRLAAAEEGLMLQLLRDEGVDRLEAVSTFRALRENPDDRAARTRMVSFLDPVKIKYAPVSGLAGNVHHVNRALQGVRFTADAPPREKPRGPKI